MPTDSGPTVEWERFMAANPGDPEAAKGQYDAYLAWRQETLPLPATALAIGSGLPRMAANLCARCREGSRIIAVLGAMYDSELGGTHEQAVAIAALLDSCVPRDSADKVTVLIDCLLGLASSTDEEEKAARLGEQGL